MEKTFSRGRAVPFVIDFGDMPLFLPVMAALVPWMCRRFAGSLESVLDTEEMVDWMLLMGLMMEKEVFEG